ncbi:OLC1v1015949C1 [Oldenlandia corymbosa var. corymbosa]|uniref:OLC1v1015949C1 n=1 Tax=Oldenlandia corymbosa var. corymbosa TaxID=529605 RepID=A0AAV1E753_OLDCO|nr:OLC1v1015949C1 [Oldenlandia corymbosa var. corymbosa]
MDQEKMKVVKTTVEADVHEVDRISELPDSLLCHILSFLPTKDSVATSIFSIRWTYLFAFVPDIDLRYNHNNPFDHQLFLDFINLCSRIILLRKGISVRKFKLFLWGVYSKRFGMTLKSFISAALLCQIQEFDIQLLQEAEANTKKQVLPGFHRNLRRKSTRHLNNPKKVGRTLIL